MPETVELDSEVACKLAEAHRPAKKPAPDAFDEMYLVQCPACDGNRWQRWAPGDPEYACELWPQVRHLVT